MAEPKISAVICTRNRSDIVAQAVESVLANTHPNFELILVDQSTNDQTEQTISRFLSDSRFRYIRSNTIGKSRACNIGLHEARGELVAYTDDDCIVPPEWLKYLEQPFIYDLRIALVFCSVLPGEYEPDLGYVPHFILRESRMIKRIEQLLHGIGMGAGMALRKSIIEALGGFDNNLGPGSRFMGGEDHDIAIRALLKQYKVYQLKDVSVIHYGFRNWSDGRSHSNREWFACGVYYIKPLKCGYPQASIILFSMIFLRVLEPFYNILSLQRPRGLLRLVYIVKGLIAGLKTPVVRDKILYSDTLNIFESMS